MGVAVANLRLDSLRDIHPFKENVTVLLISGVFVLLSASLNFEVLRLFEWRFAAFLFALLFLLPDLSMLGYLAGPRIGARVYNVAHSYLVPLGIGALGLLVALPFALPLALIWAAHIAFDRALGFGLKYEAGFGFTHLGRVGRQDPW
jgi:ABC-type phosphate/phosphonate transport system permease subunit